MMKPILFNTEMVRAILAGNKIQTRRIVKPQPKLHLREDNRIKIYERTPYNWEIKDALSSCGFSRLDHFKSKLGTRGDILWVRETFCYCPIEEESKLYYPELSDFLYKASSTMQYIKWVPSIHMPKKACRLFLKISNIKVERLQNITEDDAIKEGIKFDKESGYYFVGDNIMSSSPINAFRELWIKTYGFDSWESNPFVWVIEFSQNFDHVVF